MSYGFTVADATKQSKRESRLLLIFERAQKPGQWLIGQVQAFNFFNCDFAPQSLAKDVENFGRNQFSNGARWARDYEI